MSFTERMRMPVERRVRILAWTIRIWGIVVALVGVVLAIAWWWLPVLVPPLIGGTVIYTRGVHLERLLERHGPEHFRRRRWI